MASPSLALPGVLFVGEDERARLVAHVGPAAGWMIPRGVLRWSTEVSVVAREALGDQVRRDARIVMPEEQIAPAKMPLAHQAALKSPLVAVSSRLTRKLVDAGIRVHTVGADRVTSSFYYIAEGGGEAPVRLEGDLVAAVGAMLGERADNAAIERVLDGLVDRLLRSLSNDRVAELSLELGAALPRAASDGTGMQDVDLAAFEKELASLVGGSEKYASFLKEIAKKISDSNDDKVMIPLFADARSVSHEAIELTVGERKISLPTYTRWLATGPLTEPAKPAPAPVPQRSPAPAPVVQKAPEPRSPPRSEPRAATPKPPQSEPRASANVRPIAAPPRPGSTQKVATPGPGAVESRSTSEPEAPKAAPSSPEPIATKATPEPEPPAPPSEKIASEPEPPPPSPAKATLESLAPEPVVAKSAVEVERTAKAKAATKKKEEPAESLERDSRLSAPEKVKRKEKGIPWLWILVLVAAVFAGYRLWGGGR